MNANSLIEGLHSLREENPHSAKLGALIKILYSLLESENDSPHREDFVNVKISVKKNSLIEAAHSLRVENSHFVGKANLFQYFQMKEI